MFKRLVLIGLAVSALGFAAVADARADTWNKKTVITFSQPVEVAGHVLPAGTYTFQLMDSMTDRHIVQIFDANGTKLIATVLTIPNYRLKSTDATVIKFREVPAGTLQAVRAWFYPGNTVGEEFIYPKARALVLAKASNAVVPAVAADVTDVEALKSAPIVAVTPDETEVPVAAAIQMTPVTSAGAGTMGTRHSTRLPKTASRVPMFALFGLGACIVALGMLRLTRRAPAPVL
jgi:Protein of unknown function (DUF2911)